MINKEQNGGFLMLKKYIGDKAFYRHVLTIAFPIILQNLIMKERARENRRVKMRLHAKPKFNFIIKIYKRNRR